MKHKLGIVGTAHINVTKMGFKKGYHERIVTEDIYNWLCEHDVEIDEEGNKTFKVNRVKYKDLGLVYETDNKNTLNNNIDRSNSNNNISSI